VELWATAVPPGIAFLGKIEGVPDPVVLTQDELEVDERVFLVDDMSNFAEAAAGIEGASTAIGIEGVEADGVGGPGPGFFDGLSGAAMRPIPWR